MITKNIDGLLTQVMADEQSGHAPEPVIDAKPIESEINEPIQDESMPESTPINHEPEEENIHDETKNEPSKSNESEPSTDDYGNQVTHDEKKIDNEVMRERLKQQAESMNRRHQQELDSLRQEMLAELAKQKTQSNSQNEGSEEGWEQEFESLVVKTLNKHEQQAQQQRLKQQEAQRNAEFEIKFNTGAEKYSDFETVVSTDNLTPQMIFATRGMNDPAAFLYAASKTQQTELSRISKIPDPFVQAVELGKLEERMRKPKYVSSNAPKPVQSVSGDMIGKEKPRNIDDILRQEEAKRMKQRR